MIQDYLNEISSKFSSNLAGEHAYRAPLEKYIESNFEIDALNDPSRSEHGNPDFVFFKKNNKNLIVGYAETKDITVNLDKVVKYPF